MALYMNFDLLPALSEGDERISLEDILTVRDCHLSERELWAICMSCCAALRKVHNSSEAFRVLCITPQSLAFDYAGNICFLDQGTEPLKMYVPPEYEKVGNSYKAHMFSVGMIMFYAAEYGSASLDKTFSPKLTDLLSSMTTDEFFDRADLETVYEQCSQVLTIEEAEQVCRELAAIGRLEHRMSNDDNSCKAMYTVQRSHDTESDVPTPEANVEVSSGSKKMMPTLNLSTSPFNSVISASMKEPEAIPKTYSVCGSSKTGSPSDIVELKMNSSVSTDNIRAIAKENNTLKSNTQELRKMSPLMQAMNSKLGHRKEANGGTGGFALMSLQEILTSLKSCLHESELWSVCHQAIVALMESQNELPSYISLDTIVIAADGCVHFRSLPQDVNVNPEFRAPELDKAGPMTQKAAIFGLAASLFAAADYQLPTDVEPQLSPALQELLYCMAQDNPNGRPTLSAVMQLCSTHEQDSGMSSRAICENLLKNCRKMTSKPSEMEVHSMLHKRPGIMSTQLKTSEKTGVDQQGSQLAGSPVHLDPPSAFRSTIPANTKPLSVDPARIPSAFSSSATHFTPIVLSGDHAPAKSIKPKPAAGDMTRTPTEKEIKVARNLKQLKKNLIKNRAPINIAADIENEVGGDKLLSKTLKSVPVSQKPDSNANLSTVPSAASTFSSTTVESTAVCSVPLAVAAPSQVHNQSSPTFTAVQSVPHTMPVPPTIPVQAPTAQPIPLVAGTGVPQGMFPNFQLQQDPQTGLFQLVPVAMPAIPVQFPTTGSPVSQPEGTTTLQSNKPVTNRSSEQQSFQTSNNALGERSKKPVVKSKSDMSSARIDKMQPHASKRTESDVGIKLDKKTRGQSKQEEIFVDDTIDLEEASLNKKNTDKIKQSRSTGRDKETLHSKSKRTRSSSRDRILDNSTKSPIHENSNVKEKPGVAELTKTPKSAAPLPPSRNGMNDKISKKQGKPPRQSSTDVNDGLSESEHKEKIGKKMSSSSVTKEDVSMSSASESDLDRSLSGGNFKEERRPRSILKKKVSTDLNQGTGNLEQSPRDKAKEGSRSRKLHKNEDRTTPTSSTSIEQTSSPSGGHVKKPRSAPSESRLPLSLPSEDSPHKSASLSNSEQVDESNMLPLLSPIPPPSPSLSRDSGVCGLNNVSLPPASLVERLLNPDTLRIQQILSRVVKLIREEFAFDGYLENGVEDTAMAEYVASLGNLKLLTFANAITEKYCDLFWQEELLVKLYEAVNGRMPSISELQNRRKTDEYLSSATATVLSIDEPTEYQPRYQKANQRTYAYSPFRPISLAKDDISLPGSSSLFKPRALRLPRSYTVHTVTSRPHVSNRPGNLPSQDTSDDTDAEIITRPHRRRRVGALDKGKSSSMHDLLHSMRIPENDLNSKSLSQTALDQKPSIDFLPRTTSISGQRTKVIHVRGSGSDTDSMDLLRTKSSKLSDGLRSPDGQNTGLNDSMVTYESDSSSTTDHRLSRRIGREDSMRSFSSTQSGQLSVFSTGDSSDNVTTRSESRNSLPMAKGNAVFYTMEPIQSNVKEFEDQMGAKTKENIEAKIGEINQQMAMEEKQRLKTQKYYKKLLESLRTNKANTDQRGMLAKVSNQIREMATKLMFLASAKRHLEMLYAEQWSLSHDLLYSFAKLQANQPLHLAVVSDNPLLQFHTVFNRVAGTDTIVLHAGTALGLMSYLYARNAITDGFIHQFFYCFRYFTTPRQLLDFIAGKLSSAVNSGDSLTDIHRCVLVRSIDLIQVWLEGYFSVDFKHDPELWDSLYNFLQEQAVPGIPESKDLMQVMETCRTGQHIELGSTMDMSTDDGDLELVPEQETSTNKWGTIKAALNISTKPSVLKKKGLASCLQKKQKNDDGDVYFPTVARKEDTFTLADYTSQTLAEQLTIIEQEFFSRCHPVHFMNSQAQGIGVSLADTVTSTPGQRQSVWDDPDHHVSSKFAGSYTQDTTIQEMIEHAHNISYWVAAELVTSSSSKSQLALLSKFLHTAKTCMDMRNFASGIAILEGLETLVVRQLPAWRNLPSKSVAIKEELSSIKVSLKGDSTWLVKDEAARGTTTIPSVLLFLLHVQQIELGGFTLANGMHKWNKMRSIAKLVDQIRMFKSEQHYKFEANKELHELLRLRVQQFVEQDLHALAAQHDTNFTKMSSSSKWNKAIKSVKGKFSK